MTTMPALSVILAAGKGTRMKSALPKPLHAIAGRSLLAHAMAIATAAGHESIAVVIGPEMDNVHQEVLRQRPEARTFVQENQKGTADAVLATRPELEQHEGDVYVLFCDTPMLRTETLDKIAGTLEGGANIVVLGFEAVDPTGYGRLITDPDGSLLAIREHKDANDDERRITLCNSGVMAFRCPNLPQMLDKISDDNAKGEFYLTDIIEIARDEGLACAVVSCPESELLGINDRAQLAEAEAHYQTRLRENAMANGATLIAPETVWFSHDTVIGRDVVIEPNVFFGPGVTVEDNVLIRANCHLEGARIGAGSKIGPFARLRPGADLAGHVHIGNFVEVKNVAMGDGAKANHLAYLGDGSVGDGANIGAGTIFCNYDGFRKHRTTVGTGAFIGSNSALVAPVKIGDGAFVGSGSVITKDVPVDSLALERSEQTVRDGWAAKFRTIMKRHKS